MPHTNNKKVESWEERFNSRFPQFLEFEGALHPKLADASDARFKLKEFIHQELQKALEQEAYLWFEEWYSRTISKTSLDRNGFGHWATTRLQTLGADQSDLDQLTTKTNTK